MSAVRSLHVEAAFGNPLENYLRVKQAFRCTDYISSPANKKLPITIHVLTRLHDVILSGLNGTMLWAAFTLAFLVISELANLQSLALLTLVYTYV